MHGFVRDVRRGRIQVYILILGLSHTRTRPQQWKPTAIQFLAFTYARGESHVGYLALRWRFEEFGQLAA